MTEGHWIALIGLIWTVLIWGGTRFYETRRMEKKYMTTKAAEGCMKEREEAEERLDGKLQRVEKRMTLGNLIMARLCQELKIPKSEIESYEKALGITVNPDTT